MLDPHEVTSPAGISVTIKSDEPGGKFNDPKSPGTWIVFHGSPQRVKEQIIEVFDLPEESLSRPLYDLTNEATKLYKGVMSVGSTLGGTVIRPGTEAAPAGGQGQSAPAQSNSDEAEAESKRLLAALEAATTVQEVKEVWARNQEAFKAPALMEAYMARGKAIKEGRKPLD